MEKYKNPISLDEKSGSHKSNHAVKKAAVKKAMDFLSYRGHSEKELLQKLVRSGYSKDESEKAIGIMKEYGYVNDEQYAYDYIKRNEGKKSENRIHQELYGKGIAKEDVAKAMEDYSGEEAAISKAIDKKIQRLGEPLSLEKVKKLAAYLYRQGYRKEEVDKRLQPYFNAFGVSYH